MYIYIYIYILSTLLNLAALSQTAANTTKRRNREKPAMRCYTPQKNILWRTEVVANIAGTVERLSWHGTSSKSKPNRCIEVHTAKKRAEPSSTAWVVAESMAPWEIWAYGPYGSVSNFGLKLVDGMRYPIFTLIFEIFECWNPEFLPVSLPPRLHADQILGMVDMQNSPLLCCRFA